MKRHGGSVGSVSGGCVEEDLIARFEHGDIAGPLPTRLNYGVNRADAERFGLPCGGRLELLVEHLSDDERLLELLARIDAGELLTRAVDLDTGAVTLRPGRACDAFVYEANRLEKVFGPSWGLLLIGDGQLAHFVAQMANMLDFRVTICDPRDTAFRNPLPEGVRKSRDMPDEAVLALANHPRIAVITLAHDPRVDDMALTVALESRAFYIGALGSRRTSAKRRDRLAQLGVPPTHIDRLHAPVGLPIGSHTPAEIALSILAEVVETRNRTLHHRSAASAVVQPAQA